MCHMATSYGTFPRRVSNEMCTSNTIWYLSSMSMVRWIFLDAQFMTENVIYMVLIFRRVSMRCSDGNSPHYSFSSSEDGPHRNTDGACIAIRLHSFVFSPTLSPSHRRVTPSRVSFGPRHRTTNKPLYSFRIKINTIFAHKRSTRVTVSSFRRFVCCFN
jgi:hypothetical protein